jgi:hypothetical protein
VKHRAILVAIALAAAATVPACAESGKWTISGVVVSATTGAPLDRAEVTLSTTGDGETEIAETATSETGVFRFDGIAAGKYALEASRRGYLSASYQEHEGYFTAIVTGPNLQTQGLRLELTPYGSIGGAVSDDGGNAVADATVTLFRQDDETGEMKVVEADQQTTDDAGEYEFARLQAGTYYIDVNAQPWFAFHSNPPTNLSTGEQDAPQQSPLDVAYPLTFYPNALDSSSATPIQMNAGDRVQVNLSLHAVPAVHIQVSGGLTPDRRGVATPMLSQEVFGTAQNAGSAVPRFNGRDQALTYDFGPVAPGHYTLDQPGRGSVPVDLAGDRTLSAPPLAATVDVSGRFAMGSGAPLPEHFTASLHPLDDRPIRLMAPVDRNGGFDFPNVDPGTYEVVLYGSSLVVVQMAASGGEIHGNKVTVGSDPVLLAATLARGSATINGYAARDNKGVGGAMLLLVPSDPKANDELIRRDQSDSDGSFSLANVAPGTYTLMAIERGWGLEWKHRDAIAGYIRRGVTVKVPENQRTMNLPEPVPIQER